MISVSPWVQMKLLIPSAAWGGREYLELPSLPRTTLPAPSGWCEGTSPAFPLFPKGSQWNNNILAFQWHTKAWLKLHSCNQLQHEKSLWILPTGSSCLTITCSLNQPDHAAPAHNTTLQDGHRDLLLLGLPPVLSPTELSNTAGGFLQWKCQHKNIFLLMVLTNT